MPTARMRRVNELLREVVSDVIGGELGDPRIGFVTVTAVDTSPDLRSARVFVSVLGSEEEKEATMVALKAARGTIQRSMGAQISMKRTPVLSFRYDETVEQAARLTRMLEE